MSSFLIKLLAPDAGPDAYNDWRLVATSTLPKAALIALVLLLVTALVLTAVGLGRVAPRRRRFLIALRFLGALVVLAMLLMPAIELRAVSRVRSRVQLLFDTSRSMGLATPDGTRAERVLKHISDNQATFDRLSHDAVLEVGGFGERTRPLEGIPSALPTTEGHTDLGRAIADLTAQSAGRDLGAVLIYSDGTDTEGLTPERAHALGEKLGVPIYAVGFSAESSAADLAIERVLSDDFAFVHNTVVLDVELVQRGLKLGSVPVTLKRDGNVVATKDAKFDPDGRSKVTFEFKPNRIGKLAYEISVPVQEGEAVASNNSRSIVLKVIRDRIRVLQVAGRPSWDERFLRELLKRNPNVDLISFFILRSTTDVEKANQDELALIPFPVHELFTQELGTFDVVIYQNFTYRPYRMQPYLQNIQDYVNGGGSFVMIGGNEAFEDGFYNGTPVGDILPVRLGSGQAWDATDFRPRLTPEGRLHPITRIGEAGEPPEAVYGRLPVLSGINPSLGLVPGAQALLVHPSLPGNPPVVALREVGEGRTMAVTTDSLWAWRFVAVGEGGSGREFDRFWNAALRWMIRDPELARVRLKTERSVYALGESVGAEARVLGADYHGLEGAEVRAELAPLGSRSSEDRQEARAVTGAEGTGLLSFGSVPPGTYVLRAEAVKGNEKIGHAEEPLIVEAADVEMQAPFPRPDLLAALAEGSGGKFIDIDKALPPIEIKDPRRLEVDRTRRVPIWDSFPAFGLLLAIVGLEWWVRRRSGLL